jgi:hypothetical protein
MALTSTKRPAAVGVPPASLLKCDVLTGLLREGIEGDGLRRAGPFDRA